MVCVNEQTNKRMLLLESKRERERKTKISREKYWKIPKERERETYSSRDRVIARKKWNLNLFIAYCVSVCVNYFVYYAVVKFALTSLFISPLSDTTKFSQLSARFSSLFYKIQSLAGDSICCSSKVKSIIAVTTATTIDKSLFITVVVSKKIQTHGFSMAQVFKWNYAKSACVLNRFFYRPLHMPPEHTVRLCLSHTHNTLI